MTSPSSSQSPFRSFEAFKKHHAPTRKTLFGTPNHLICLDSNSNSRQTLSSSSSSSSKSSSSTPIISSQPQLSSSSPTLNSNQNQNQNQHLNLNLNSNSNSIIDPIDQSNHSSLPQSSPGTWSVSGKLVRKKASGLFREAARSWGRSKSKEVLSFGLGVLIGNPDHHQINSHSSSTGPISSLNSIDKSSSSIHPSTPLHSNRLESSNKLLHTSNSVMNTIGRAPKKRISFHGTKKLKGKDKTNSKLKRRSEIGFGDWADTLNTAVASSSPISPPIPAELKEFNHHTFQNDEIDSPLKFQSSTIITPNHQHQLESSHHLNSLVPSSSSSSQPSQPSQVMTLPIRRRDRSTLVTRHQLVTPAIELQPPSSSTRVPRSTFPHSHRSPRSPRRIYNTRATATRTQSLQNQSSCSLLNSFDLSTPRNHPSETSLPSHLNQYQQLPPLTSSPFKRACSTSIHLDHHPNLHSPTKSRVMDQTKSVSLKSTHSARINLFGATPNQSGGLEPIKSKKINSTLNHNPKSQIPSTIISSDPNLLHSSTTIEESPRLRQSVISNTLSNNKSSHSHSQIGFDTLIETDQDSDLGFDEIDFNHSISSSSQSQKAKSPSPILSNSNINNNLKGPSNLIKPETCLSNQYFENSLENQSNSSSIKPYWNHSSFKSNETWSITPIDGIKNLPRRYSLDESCEDNDLDERVTQTTSSKASSNTSILSSFTPCESFQASNNLAPPLSSSSLQLPTPNIDGFGALPPPESPFPGSNRIKSISNRSHTTISPNKLKRDLDGEPVGFMISSHLHNLHRPNLQSRLSSSSNQHFHRQKSDPFEVIYHNQTDSWSHQSNEMSEEDDDDDDDDNGLIGHNDLHTGSHESHEGMSNLSVPGLTDSSSLASSLASSNQSSNHPYQTRTPVDNNNNNNNLVSTGWNKSETESGRKTKRRSLPTNLTKTNNHQNLNHLPPLPINSTSTPLSNVKHSLAQHPSLRTLVQSNQNPSSIQEIDFSFQNVKPNASAFLSSGMISKKTLARDRRESSFTSNSPFLQYALTTNDIKSNSHLENSSFLSNENSIALKSMREALGGPHIIAAAIREDQEIQQRIIEQYDQSLSFNNNHHHQSSSPHHSSLGLLLPDCFRKHSNSSLRMPDTPMKKSHTIHKVNHLHHNKPLVPSNLSKTACSYSSSLDGSPIENSPTSRNRRFPLIESPSLPPSLVCPKTGSISLKKSNQTQTGSSSKCQVIDDFNGSPSISNHLDSFKSQELNGLVLDSSSVKHSSIYRRRSSDGILGHQSKSNNLSRSNNPFEEPGTPTKVPPIWLKRAPQLLNSPGNSISSGTSSPSLPYCNVKLPLNINSNSEQIIDPQVTPHRNNGRLYNSLKFSPIASINLKQGSSSTLVTDHDPSRLLSSPPLQLSSFQNQHLNNNKSHQLPRRSDDTLIDFNNIQSNQADRFESEFDVVETIGIGEFGEVFKVRQDLTGKVFAVKRAKRTANGPKALGRQFEEVDILRRLTQGPNRSEFIIQLHDSWQDSNRWYLQTEYCENGTLERFLELIARLQDRLDEERIWKITSELSQAIGFIHSTGVLHLDIKPANVLITAHGGLKVGDFGLAKRWPRINPKEVCQIGLLEGLYPIYEHKPTTTTSTIEDDKIKLIPKQFLRYEDISDTEERQMMRFKNSGRFIGFDLEREGDREYIAPEILSGRYGEEADVFSVGLIALEIGTNIVLPDNGDEWRGLRSSDFSRMDLSHLSSELVLLIKRMMDKCPDRRITTTELGRHPVLSKLKNLRQNGLLQESNHQDEINMIDLESKKVELIDDEGDTKMFINENDLNSNQLESIKPWRPSPPKDNIWKIARGAVLPEAEGFLQFILTGQSTPSRRKGLLNGLKVDLKARKRNDEENQFTELQAISVVEEVKDKMEIDF
ncbi:hypothetical protein O181_016816 [Austropuccinia psidii MF-1]|uniref:Protein kinase domain-containing protein n=1 Tax=Austropuccinia psidii MF-1 TaxID=1389203 RepID=A0A9Q3GRF1_9BASI|nr:hypothetical protein [Austropuccinia psidii MF-1]